MAIFASTRCSGGLSGRLESLREERRDAAWRSLGYLAAAPVAVAASALGLFAAGAAAVAVAAALVASWWWFRAWRGVRRQANDVVDDLILHGWEKAAPEAVETRLVELLSARNRRRLARLLVTGVYVSPSCAHASVQRMARELRRERERLDRLVQWLEDLERPVDPRGVILVSRLLSDCEESPLHAGEPEALGPELQRIERLI